MTRSSTLSAIARGVFLGSLVCALAGCKTDFHLVQANTSVSSDGAVTLTVEADIDLEAAKWTDHMLQFRFVIMRGDDCLTGTMLDRAKQVLEDSQMDNTVFDFRDLPEAERTRLLEVDGGVEPLGTGEPGRWRYRIRIPRSMVEMASREDYSDPLQRGSSYWLAGTVIVIKYMLIPWAESDLLITRLTIPAK